MTRLSPPVPPDTGSDVVAPGNSTYWSPEDTYVPADRRWAGLDCTTIGPSLGVIALAILMAFVLPAVNQMLAYADPIAQGDVIRLRGVTFEPPAGWGLVEGKRAGTSDTPVYPSEAELEHDAVRFRVEYSSYDGTPAELLEDVRQTNDALAEEVNVLGEPVAIKTSAGMPGMVAKYAGASTDGIIAAFVFNGSGVSAVATGPSEDFVEQDARDVGRMLLTMTPVEESAP